MVTHQLLANAVRFLSMDAIECAKSGHPGMPLGMADIATVLWKKYLKYNPRNPNWLNRDRFIISNGHGSMLLYALLHLAGYDLSIEEIKNFRQLHSKTPGHPEWGCTPGVETTTGPLGQGIANAVGIALAEKILSAQFNRPNHEILDHCTYVFLGDGCLMEGISHEACSLAGTWKLSKLIVFWDDNGISIDGQVNPWFTENIPQRFASYGWNVIPSVDGHDAQAIGKAIEEAKKNTEQPTLIACKTIIGFGAPTLAGTCHVHGMPLGKTEIAAAREKLNWPHPPFSLPEAIREAWSHVDQGRETEADWERKWKSYESAYPELAKEFLRRLNKEWPLNWSSTLNRLKTEAFEQTKCVATRKASLTCLNLFASELPELIGGSADLTSSNCTEWKNVKTLLPNQFDANYIHYGVREFGMSAILNGLSLYGGFIPFGGTFLTFSDYARNAVRMAALMKQRVIFIYSHDSIGLGEDGPTHQPVEHIAALRLIPNLHVWRPCDMLETAVAWESALGEKETPSCILLTRQDLPAQMHTREHVAAIARGAYILKESKAEPELIILATGSEVQLAVKAAELLNDRSIRIISMPCLELFEQQTQAYRDSLLPPKVKKRLAIEMGVSHSWFKYVGIEGKVVGIDRFGESAPAEKLFSFFRFTVENIFDKIKLMLEE